MAKNTNQLIAFADENIKNFIMGNIFSEFPSLDEDGIEDPFLFFMETDIDDIRVPVNHSNFYEWGYVVCEENELKSVECIRNIMREKVEDLTNLQERLCNSNKSIYMVYQYNKWFNYDSKVLFGVFTNKTFDEVKEIMMDGFEKLYKGFKDDVYVNGSQGDQFITDKHKFGVMIEEIGQVNEFGEM